MAGRREITQGQCFAKRTILTSPQDELALTVGDTTTFAALSAQETATAGTRETLVQTSRATKETLST